MSTTVEHLPDEAASVELRFRGRVWPSLSPQTDAALQPVRELSDREIEPDLASIVVTDLHAGLRSRDVDNGDDISGEDIVAAYVASLDQLQTFRREAEFLIEAVCLSHIEFEQVTGRTDEAQRGSSEKALLESMLGRANLRLPVAGNIATADLLAGPVDVLRQTLGEHLQASISSFTTELFEVFNRMVDAQLAGLFEWSAAGTCRYHFFREIIRQEINGTSRTDGSGFITGFDEDGEEIQIRRTTTTHTTSGRDTIRLARHEHHVMRAYQTSLENTQVVIPLAVQEMIAAIPRWLAPYISVIDGTLFREKIISRDYRTDDWSQVRVSTVDLPVLDCEPAVLIGNVVLAGWGPTEIAIELERRDEVAREQAQTALKQEDPQRTVPAFAPTLLHLAAITLMGLAFTVSPAWLLISLFCSVGAFWAGVITRSESRGIRGTQPTPVRNTIQSVAATLASAAAQFFLTAILLMNGWLAAIGVACMIGSSILHTWSRDDV